MPSRQWPAGRVNPQQSYSDHDTALTFGTSVRGTDAEASYISSDLGSVQPGECPVYEREDTSLRKSLGERSCRRSCVSLTAAMGWEET